MITTLPGLYWISFAILKAVSLIFTIDETCTVIHLRSMNVLFATGNFALLWKLVNVLDGGFDMVITLFTCVNITFVNCNEMTKHFCIFFRFLDYSKQCANYRTIALACKQDPSSDHTGKDPHKDRNRNCRRTGGIPTTKGY